AIRDAVSRVSDLPNTISGKPVIKEHTSASLPVLEIALSGNVPELELRKYAKELESQMKEISGVSSIPMVGYRKREIKINVDIKELKEEKISFAEILHAIKSRNVRSTGGTIESFVSEKKIVTLAEYEKPLDVKNAIIRSNFLGNSVRISKLASITPGFKDPQILYHGNAKPGISLMVFKQESADILDVSDELKTCLSNFKKTLPKSVEASLIYDYSVLTEIMLDMVLKNGLMGFVLVLLVMFLFLDIRSAFWCAFGIPFSIFGALILFRPFGINLNMITLTSMILVLGIIVDDAIVITEKIYSLKQEGMSPLKASLEGVKSMLMPVSAAVGTTIMAFGSLLFIPGVMGKFTYSIPMVITILLLFSLGEALFFIPVHLLNANPHAEPHAKPPWRIRWLNSVKEWYHRTILAALEKRFLVLETAKAWYHRTIFAALKKRSLVLAGYLLLLLTVLIFSYNFMRFMLDEDIDPDFFGIIIETPQGTSLARTAKMTGDIEKEVSKTIPKNALQSFTSHVGHHDVALMGTGGGQYSNWAVIKVFLIPAAHRSITSEKIMDMLKPKLKILKKEKGFHRLNVEQMPGLPVGKAIHVIYTTNNDSIRKKFEDETLKFLRERNKKLMKKPGSKKDVISSIETSNIPGKEELQLKLDYSKLARMGLTSMEVAQTVRTAFDGAVATSIRFEGEDIDFRVRLKAPKKYRAHGILELPVANREGRLIALKHFAEFDPGTGPAVINHYRGKRSVAITANVNSKIITPSEVNALIRKEFEKKAAAIPGLTMKLAGQEEEASMSMGGLFLAGLVILVAIYFLLVILFNSYLQPALIMSIIPYAVMGVFLTLIIHNRPLILISLMGLLGLIGIVVNDTIVMISHINSVCKEQGKSIQAIANACVDRFRPVILTTLTTFAGLLPTAYGFGGDIPSLRPMVLTLAWGLVFSTTVTLGFIPILYSFITVRSVKEENDPV
ncbi:MAG: efflux RND transporter permease subunit, partial [bacterium]|nr:efflux RND transporter permease subunit [bacterium]